MVGGLFANLFGATYHIKGKGGARNVAHKSVFPKEGFKEKVSKGEQKKPPAENGQAHLFKQLVAVESAKLNENLKGRKLEQSFQSSSLSPRDGKGSGGNSSFKSGEVSFNADFLADAGIKLLGKKSLSSKKTDVSGFPPEKKGDGTRLDKSDVKGFHVAFKGYKPSPNRTGGKGRAEVNHILNKSKNTSHPSYDAQEEAKKRDDVAKGKGVSLKLSDKPFSFKNREGKVFEKAHKASEKAILSDSRKKPAARFTRMDASYPVNKKEGLRVNEGGVAGDRKSDKPPAELLHVPRFKEHGGERPAKSGSSKDKAVYGRYEPSKVHEDEKSLSRMEGKLSDKTHISASEKNSDKAAFSSSGGSSRNVMDEVVKLLSGFSGGEVVKEKPSSSSCHRILEENRSIENLREMFSGLKTQNLDKSEGVEKGAGENFLQVYLKQEEARLKVYNPKLAVKEVASNGSQKLKKVQDRVGFVKGDVLRSDKRLFSLFKRSVPLKAEVYVMDDATRDYGSKVVDGSKVEPAVTFKMASKDGEKLVSTQVLGALSRENREAVKLASALRAEFGEAVVKAKRVPLADDLKADRVRVKKEKVSLSENGSVDGKFPADERHGEKVSHLFDRLFSFKKSPHQKEQLNPQYAEKAESSLNRHAPADDSKLVDSGFKLTEAEKMKPFVFHDKHHGTDTVSPFKKMEVEKRASSNYDTKNVFFNADGAKMGSEALHRSNTTGEAVKFAHQLSTEKVFENDLTFSSNRVAFVVLDEKDLKGHIKILTKGDEHVKVIFNLNDSATFKIAASLTDLRNNLLKHGFQDVFVGLGNSGGNGERKDSFSNDENSGVKEYVYKASGNSRFSGFNSELPSQGRTSSSNHINTLA